MRYLKILFLSLAIIGLMSGSAFAAASLNAGNTTMASELIPAGGVGLGAVNNAYQTGGVLSAGSNIKVSLTNGTFNTVDKIMICDGTAVVDYGSTAPVLNATSVTIATTRAMGTAAVYNLQSAAGIVTCAVLTPGLTTLQLDGGLVGGGVFSMTIDNPSLAGDPSIYATAPIRTIVDQFSIELTPVTSIIGFAGSMMGFPAPAVLTSTLNYSILSNETIATRIATGLAGVNNVCGAMAAGAGKELTYTATPGTGFNFSGIAAATGFSYSIGAGAATVIDNAIATGDASATGNVDTPTFRVCGSASTPATKAVAADVNHLILAVNGTTVLTPRTYNIKIDTKTGAIILASPRTLTATQLGWTWRLDATQFYVPLVGSIPASGRETFIKLQSKSTAVGSNGVSVAILASDGTTTAVYNPGTIVSGVPMLITGAQLVAAAAAATPPKTVDGAAGFAVIITVNSAQADVFGYANMTDISGAKRIPMRIVGGNIVE